MDGMKIELAWSTFGERYKTNKFEHVLAKAVEVNKQLQLVGQGEKLNHSL